MNEDKQAVCDALCVTLSMTRMYSNLVELRYESGTGWETVTPVFTKGYKGNPINVHYDSGWALIKDVVNPIEG